MTQNEISETAERLLDAAERLFGDRGVADVSLRDITSEAGTNVASVNYHFRSRQGLVQAVFNRRMGPLNNERIRMLDLAETAAGDSAPTLEAILRAFIGPTFRLVRDHPHYMRYLARIHLEPEGFAENLLHSGRFPELVERMRRLLTAALPESPASELWWGTSFVMGAMINTWSKSREIEKISRGEARYEGDEEMIDRLVAFGAGGIRALVRSAGEVKP